MIKIILKIDEKSYKNIVIHYIGYLTIKIWLEIRKNLYYKSFVPFFDKANGYFEGVNGHKCYESKEKVKI